MGELTRTMVVCGLISGTQPITLLGMLTLLAAPNGRRTVWWYLFGCFTIQLVVVLVCGYILGATIDESSPSRSIAAGLRMGAGAVLVAIGLLLRRRPAPPTTHPPKIMDRLADLRPVGAFVAGVAIADYTGAALAAADISTSDLTSTQAVASWLTYCVFATGIPVACAMAISRSTRAELELRRATDWVMRNRHALASWICLGGGLLLIGDGALALG